MKMIRSALPTLISCLLFLIIAVVADRQFATSQEVAKASIEGVWNASAQTDDGEQTSVWTIKRSGGKYSGQYVSSRSNEERQLTNIVFDGKQLTFEIEVEAQNQTVLINVVSTVNENKIEGEWTASSDGQELASGSVSAVKKNAISFAGKWNTTATLNNGEELKGLLALTGKNSDLKGEIKTEDNEVQLDKIAVKQKTIRMEFEFSQQGESRTVLIDATTKSGKLLDGKWTLLDSDGNEASTGDWTANRAEPATVETSTIDVLFDGTSLDSFRGYHQEAIGKGWSIVDGTLHLDGKEKTGDIITRKKYGNFELQFEWKISEGGNSGVMYRVSLGDKKPYLTGPEYQVLDDAKHKDGKFESRTAGSLYALYVPKNKTLKPVGQWNSSKIVLNGNLVEHWLNGRKVVEAEIGSEDWKEKVAASKFKEWTKFGKNATGHICFQDHRNPVWFRNIRIKSLD